MPEEINRLATDAIADVLWTPSPDGDEHLLAEGVSPDKIERVGNIMIDSFELMRPKIEAAGVAAKYGLTPRGYGVVTLHRPSNVDHKEQLTLILERLLAVAQRVPLVFPVHPRTRQRLEEFGLTDRLERCEAITLLEPLAYVQFMGLVVDCGLAITDSGGIQEETSYLGIPCLTLRDNTELPITVTAGSNRLIKPHQLEGAVAEALQGAAQAKPIPLWDGRTAERVVERLRTRILAGSA
jgi:UDP-N-acetylglucosamine 2-epimerase (non-hydrolysing)